MSDTGTKPAGESICGTCGEEMEWCEYDDGTNGQFICGIVTQRRGGVMPATHVLTASICYQRDGLLERTGSPSGSGFA